MSIRGVSVKLLHQSELLIAEKIRKRAHPLPGDILINAYAAKREAESPETTEVSKLITLVAQGQ